MSGGQVPAPRWRQLSRYLLVGGLNTALGYGLFALCYLTLEGRVPYVLILTLAHLGAVTLSFANYRLWVFGGPGQPGWWASWARFQWSYLGLLAVGLLVNGVMLKWLTGSVWLAQGAATVAGVGVGWFVHRHYVFRSTSRQADAPAPVDQAHV